MFRWFVRLLYESPPAEYSSAYALAESVERLSAATKRSVFSALAETKAVGKVSEKGDQCISAIGQLEFRLCNPRHCAVDWHMAPTVVGVVVWFSAIGSVGLLVVVRH